MCAGRMLRTSRTMWTKRKSLPQARSLQVGVGQIRLKLLFPLQRMKQTAQVSPFSSVPDLCQEATACVECAPHW